MLRTPGLILPEAFCAGEHLHDLGVSSECVEIPPAEDDRIALQADLV